MSLLGTCWICLRTEALDADGLCPRCSVRGEA